MGVLGWNYGCPGLGVARFVGVLVLALVLIR